MKPALNEPVPVRSDTTLPVAVVPDATSIRRMAGMGRAY